MVGPGCEQKRKPDRKRLRSKMSSTEMSVFNGKPDSEWCLAEDDHLTFS